LNLPPFAVIALALLNTNGISATATDYGKMPDGRTVKHYTLTNAHGLRVTLLDYGATLASVETPDRHGVLADITLGYDDFAGWLGDPSHFGVSVGRFANRIADGKFTLDGKTYSLAKNNSPGGIPCHLHGGLVGFDKVLWTGRTQQRKDATGVEFTYISRDGEEGYPGTLTTKVTYWLSENDELAIEYHATTDRTTILNLTNHAYWNLSGDARQPITGHRLELDADAMLPVNAGLIPTGERRPVKGTPFDFTTQQEISARLGESDEQLKYGNGYDHCWIIRGESGLRRAARVHEPKSGRVLELYTDHPGVQFYSGNFLKGVSKGKGGVVYQFRTGFCLEPENFPDAPNQPSFPSAVLKPGEIYRRTILWRFSTE